MSESAEYLRVQYVPDLFRAEPKNVGVIVRRQEEVAARFVAENEPGQLDGRTLRTFPHPGVYSQWVEYWREVLEADGVGGIEEILQSSGDHYRVIPGGEVSDIGKDSINEVATYLYSLLVSEGGFSEAMEPALDEEAQEEEAGVTEDLDEAISDELERMNILTSEEEPPTLIPYPVLRRPRIKGKKARDHRPAYAQENGRLDVIETIDFQNRFRSRTKDHAGWMAYMFDDIRGSRMEAGEDVRTISVMRWDDEYAEEEELNYARSLLFAESDEVVNWFNDAQRTAFLQERRQIAFQEI